YQFVVNLWDYENDRDAWIFSPAISLTSGVTYRITFWTRYGYMEGDGDNFEVKIAQTASASAMAAGTEVYKILNGFVEDWIQVSYFFTPSTTGNFYLGFHAFTAAYDGDAIAVDDILVKEASANLLEMSAGAYYTQIPVTQILPPVTAKVENGGTATQTNVTMTTTLNGTSVGNASVASLASGASTNLTVTPATANPAMGNNTVASNVTSTQGATASSTMSFTGTADTYAVDDASSTDDGIGAGAPVSFGNIFDITSPTSILQVTLGFGYDPSVLNFSISLYAMTGDLTINSTPLFTQSATRTGLGFFTFDVPATALTPGKYALIVNQLTTTYLSIMYDSNPTQLFYQLIGTDLVPIPGFGALAIRMIVGTQQANDAAITAITAPVSGLNLSATEPVIATIRNNGENAITSMTLELTVDGGTPVTEPFSTSIASGASLNYTLTNTADLSAPGSHTVKVRAILAGDGNPANDAMTVTITNTICNVISDYPFTENFDGYTGTTYNTVGIVPPCWYSTGDVTTYVPHIVGSGTYNFYHSSPNSLMFTGGPNYAGENSYVVLPPFDKSLEQLSISFWYKYESTSYGTFTIGYITGSQSNVSSYVPLFTVPATTTVTQAEYNLADAGVDLSDATYIVLRWNYIGTSYWSFGIDDINVDAILGNDAAITAITAPVSGVNLTATEPVTATIKNAGGNPIPSVQMKLTVDAGTPITENFACNLAPGATTNYTFTATADLSVVGNHTITVEVVLAGDENTANNSITKTVTNVTCDGVTSFPWTEDFEGATFPPACWSIIDADGDGWNWQNWLYAQDGTVMPVAGHNSTTAAGSASYYNTVGALSPNNWLITPPLQLPPSSIVELKYWIGAIDAIYFYDHYEVRVSTTGTNTADFTDLLYQETLTSNVWKEVSIDLSAYAGQTIYIAFVHNNSHDVYIITLDDISVTVTTGLNNNTTGNISVYPNPVSSTFVITNAAGSKAKIYDVSGKTVLELPVQDAYQTVDISNVSAGVYFLDLQSQTSKSTVKLIKK
ncbi:MAG: choice-of-anchor J domain-containing protein, partial [Paludibacter sp.]|nr:choice-of-anchor J domain-containing protein [Paludibacter sp.]